MAYWFRMKAQPFLQSTKFVSIQIENKAYKPQTQIFEEMVDQISHLLKKKEEEKSTQG